MKTIALEINHIAADEIECADIAKAKAVSIQNDYGTYETMFTFSDDSVIVLSEGGYVDVYQTVDDALDNVSSKSFGGAA